jgi:hypothetical protein
MVGTKKHTRVNKEYDYEVLGTSPGNFCNLIDQYESFDGY